jgi:hypothetical protein
MPNNAMMTVTTADSKYSRQTVFGGPFGFTGAGGGLPEFPLRLNILENAEGLTSTSSFVAWSVVKLLAIQTS